jgi:hypothetical protein
MRDILQPIWICKTLARPLSFGSKSWTMKGADERRLIPAEMCFMRCTVGCFLSIPWKNWRNRERSANSTNNGNLRTAQKKLEGTYWQDSEKGFKISAKMRKKFWKTSNMMEGLCFAVCPLIGLSRPNIWKEEKEVDSEDNNDDLTAI